TADGAAATDSTTVANSAPVVVAATVTPGAPKTNDTVSANPTATDPDGDTVTYSYQWKKNGTDISGATASTLDLSAAGNGDKGDSISYSATASDGAAA